MIYGTEHSNQKLFWTGNLKHAIDLRLKLPYLRPNLFNLSGYLCYLCKPSATVNGLPHPKWRNHCISCSTSVDLKRTLEKKFASNVVPKLQRFHIRVQG